jgi:hypothetical protein
MKRWFVIAAVLCVGLIGGTAHAGNGTPINTGSAATLTLAVFGDWPYGDAFDPAHPSDAQFVESVIWEESQIVFVTLNMPGSNNDGLPWSSPFTNEVARLQEVAERTGADIRWLRRAFALAEANEAAAVLIALQADMWDPAALPAPPNDGLSGYTAFVHELANLSVHFGKPVLLINGDSHLFEADRPLANPAGATGLIHATQAVPNLTRITVQGSTNKPREWLRLTIEPRSSAVFSWENVVYCDDTTCP